MKKYVFLLCGALILLWIWGNSLLNASRSAAESQWVLDWVRATFSGMPGMQYLNMYTIRKLAHLAEYMILGFFLSLSSVALWKKNRIIWVILCGAIIAMVDECMQLFSPGRSSEVIDVIIDTVGVFVGTLLVWVWNKYK